MKQYTCPTCAGVILHNNEKKVFECRSCGVVFDYSYFDSDFLLRHAIDSQRHREWNASGDMFSKILEKEPGDVLAVTGKLMCRCEVRSFTEMLNNCDRAGDVSLDEYIELAGDSDKAIFDLVKKAQPHIRNISRLNRQCVEAERKAKLTENKYQTNYAKIQIVEEKRSAALAAFLDEYEPVRRAQCLPHERAEIEKKLPYYRKEAEDAKAEFDSVKKELEKNKSEAHIYLIKAEILFRDLCLKAGVALSANSPDVGSDDGTADSITGGNESLSKSFSYVCPQCAGRLVREQDQLVCSYCGNEFDYEYFESEELIKKSYEDLKRKELKTAKKGFGYILAKEPSNIKALYGNLLATSGLSNARQMRKIEALDDFSEIPLNKYKNKNDSSCWKELIDKCEELQKNLKENKDETDKLNKLMSNPPSVSSFMDKKIVPMLVICITIFLIGMIGAVLMLSNDAFVIGAITLGGTVLLVLGIYGLFLLNARSKASKQEGPYFKQVKEQEAVLADNKKAHLALASDIEEIEKKILDDKL